MDGIKGYYYYLEEILNSVIQLMTGMDYEQQNQVESTYVYFLLPIAG